MNVKESISSFVLSYISIIYTFNKEKLVLEKKITTRDIA